MKIQYNAKQLTELKELDQQNIKKLSENLQKLNVATNVNAKKIKNIIEFLKLRQALMQALIDNNNDEITVASQLLQNGFELFENAQENKFIISLINESKNILSFAEDLIMTNNMDKAMELIARGNLITEYQELHKSYAKSVEQCLKNTRFNLEEYIQIKLLSDQLNEKFKNLMQKNITKEEVAHLKQLDMQAFKLFEAVSTQFKKIDIQYALQDIQIKLEALKNEIVAASDFNRAEYREKFKLLSECLLEVNDLYYNRVNRPVGIINISKHPAILSELHKLITDKDYRQTRHDFQIAVVALTELSTRINSGEKVKETDYTLAYKYILKIGELGNKMLQSDADQFINQQISQSRLNYEMIRKRFDPYGIQKTQPLKLINKQSFVSLSRQRNKNETATPPPSNKPHDL